MQHMQRTTNPDYPRSIHDIKNVEQSDDLYYITIGEWVIELYFPGGDVVEIATGIVKGVYDEMLTEELKTCEECA